MDDKKRFKRKLIYVDASGIQSNSRFQISLYDPNKGDTFTLKLDSTITNSTQAELYAIYYAVYYIQKNSYKNAHILCDNNSAVNSQEIEFLVKSYKIGLSWIPREANVIADKASKLKPTQKEKELNILNFIVELSRLSSMDIPSNVTECRDKILTLNSKIDELQKSLITKSKLVDSQTNNIKSLNLKIDDLYKNIDTKSKKIDNQANHIKSLNNKINTLNSKN